MNGLMKGLDLNSMDANTDSIRIIKWPDEAQEDLVLGFLERPAFDVKAERVAVKVLDDIRKMAIRLF